MSVFQYANNPQTTLSGAIAAGDSSISVASGATFPARGKFTIIVDSEIMLVTGVTGTTWTVERGYDGTSAAAHNNNAAVTGILTKQSFLNAHVIDVRAFGATGDGVTDDLPAFDAAMDAVTNDNHTIYIPAGTYLLSDEWEIDAEQIDVVADPGALIKTTAPTTNGGAVTFRGNGILSPNTASTPQRQRFSWRGGRISATGSGTLDNALSVTRCSQVHISDVRLDADRKGFTAQYGVENLTLERVVVERGDYTAITIETETKRATLRNIEILDSGGPGIHVMSTDDVLRRNEDIRIENVVIHNAATYGVLAGATNRLTVRNVRPVVAPSGVAHYTDCLSVDSDLPGVWSASSTSRWEAAWQAATLLNSWVNYGSSFSDAGYILINGQVHLRGSIKNGTTTPGTTLFTLPVGYHPSGHRSFPAMALSGATATLARILILNDGSVQLAGGGAATQLSLDGISFLAK